MRQVGASLQAANRTAQARCESATHKTLSNTVCARAGAATLHCDAPLRRSIATRASLMASSALESLGSLTAKISTLDSAERAERMARVVSRWRCFAVGLELHACGEIVGRVIAERERAKQSLNVTDWRWSGGGSGVLMRGLLATAAPSCVHGKRNTLHTFPLSWPDWTPPSAAVGVPTLCATQRAASSDSRVSHRRHRHEGCLSRHHRRRRRSHPAGASLRSSLLCISALARPNGGRLRHVHFLQSP